MAAICIFVNGINRVNFIMTDIWYKLQQSS